MTIYHGSTIPVVSPIILKSERMLDFGVGLYTTSNKNQADRWSEIVAVKQKADIRIISEYEFDLNAAKRDLAIITFGKPDFDWLDFICLNRSGGISTEPYDIAIGPVANDQAYAVVTLYEQGVLSRQAAITELKVRELYDQILFHTDESLNYFRYVRHYSVRG